jgi:hypothetical protein
MLNILISNIPYLQVNILNPQIECSAFSDEESTYSWYKSVIDKTLQICSPTELGSRSAQIGDVGVWVRLWHSKQAQLLQWSGLQNCVGRVGCLGFVSCLSSGSQEPWLKAIGRPWPPVTTRSVLISTLTSYVVKKLVSLYIYICLGLLSFASGTSNNGPI